MRYTYTQFQELLPELAWSAEELADKLSLVGFETELEDHLLNVTVTANRADCKKLEYLVFDLAAIFNLITKPNLVELKPGQAINVTLEQINRLLGTNVTPEQYKQLTRLGFSVTETTVIAPQFRVDMQEVSDVAEEIVRLLGSEIINVKPLNHQSAVKSAEFEDELALKRALAACGLTETITSSFSDRGKLALKNPFSQEEPYLRSDLLDGLLKTLARNPFLKKAAFFEIGHVFTPNEEQSLAIVLAGYKDIAQFSKPLEKLLETPLEFKSIDQMSLAKFNVKQTRVSWTSLPLSKITYGFHPTEATDKATLPSFKPISKYPPLVRDVTLTTANGSTNLVAPLHQMFPELLLCELIDQYQPAGANTINLTYRLLFQKFGSTFTEQEIEKIDKKLASHFQ